MLEGAEVIAGNQELGKVVHKSLQEFHRDAIQADWTVVGDQVFASLLEHRCNISRCPVSVE